jgi:hypothetical protein
MTTGVTAQAAQTVVSVPEVGAVLAPQVHERKKVPSMEVVVQLRPGISAFSLTIQTDATHWLNTLYYDNLSHSARHVIVTGLSDMHQHIIPEDR